MLHGGRLRRWALLCALPCAGACSSSYEPESEPIDPEVAARARAERDRLRAEREAQEAAQAELERSVQEIESTPGEPPPPLQEDEVSKLFLYYCGECHSARQVGQATDGMFGIEDLELMIWEGKITPGDGERSRLIVRIRDGNMPPPTSDWPPMPPPSVDRIAAFIDDLPVPEQK